MSGQHSKDKVQIMLWLSRTQVAKLLKMQEKFGKSRTEIIDLLVEKMTEAQLGFMLGGKQPVPSQPPPTKPAVTPPPSVPPRSFSPAPKKGAK